MGIKTKFEELGAWGKTFAGLVAGFAAVGIVYAFLATTYNSVHWQVEADELQAQLEQQHSADLAAVYQVLADEKKYDRVQRNVREYNRLKLDYENELWETQGGKELMLDQIRKLNAAICRDDPEEEDCA